MKRTLLTLVVALAGVGCGGDDDSVGEPTHSAAPPLLTKPVSLAEYTAVVEPACVEARERLDPLAGEAAAALETGDLAAAGRTFRSGFVEFEETYEELAALPKPDGFADGLDRTYDLVDDAIAAGHRVADALLSGNAAQARAAALEGERLADRAAAGFAAVGMRGCANASPALSD